MPLARDRKKYLIGTTLVHRVRTAGNGLGVLRMAPKGTGVRNIQVHKSELLDKLRENRKGHRAIVEDAWKGYKAEVIRQLEKQLKRARKGVKKQIAVYIPIPEDHTDDYDRAIAMLEMEVRDVFEVTEQEFENYVRDQWNWSGAFLATNSTYTGLALGKG